MQISEENTQSYLFRGFWELKKFAVFGIEIRTSLKDTIVLEPSVTNVSEKRCQCRRHCLTSVTVFVLTAKRTQNNKQSAHIIKQQHDCQDSPLVLEWPSLSRRCLCHDPSLVCVGPLFSACGGSLFHVTLGLV